MTYEDFLTGLDGVIRRSDTQADARCPVPAHDDRNASLSILHGDDAIALTCFKGCTVEAICHAWGCELRDLFFNVIPLVVGGPVRLPPPRRLPAPRPAGGTTRINGKVSMPPIAVVEHWHTRIHEVAGRLYELKGWTLQTLSRFQVGFDGERVVFPVYDVEGRLVGLVRYKPGRKPKTMAVGDRHLWPAPESVEASHVWLVEGEPDMLSAAEIGLDAIAVPGVAIWKQDWELRFVGKRVTVCFDCDSEGREGALKRAESLRSAGVDVRVVDLDPGRDDSFDVGDCVALAVSERRVPDLCAYLLRLQGEAWKVAA